MPESNYFYPVFDHTEFVQEFGQVPDYTCQQLQEAARMAEQEGERVKLERIVQRVAKSAPAFDPQLAQQIITLHPQAAQQMAGNENLDDQSARVVENYAVQCLTQLPLPDDQEGVVEFESEVLAETAEVLGALAQHGHSWQDETTEQLMSLISGKGEAGKRAYNPRPKWAAQALLSRSDPSVQQIQQIWEQGGSALGQLGFQKLVTHPQTPRDLAVEITQKHGDAVGGAIMEHPSLRNDQRIRDALIGKADIPTLVELLKDNRPEEFQRLIRALFEIDIKKGFQLLERPRFKAMAEGMLDPKALMPAIRHGNDNIREKAMRMISHLEEDGQIEERFQAELEKRGLDR